MLQWTKTLNREDYGTISVEVRGKYENPEIDADGNIIIKKLDDTLYTTLDGFKVSIYDTIYCLQYNRYVETTLKEIKEGSVNLTLQQRSYEEIVKHCTYGKPEVFGSFDANEECDLDLCTGKTNIWRVGDEVFKMKYHRDKDAKSYYQKFVIEDDESEECDCDEYCEEECTKWCGLC